ncbi:Uncharacterized protein Rs2_04976 [Raphanus sativus]|nr:Uncharacterized protein Rs2_04976 [Raphanus sativus]
MVLELQKHVKQMQKLLKKKKKKTHGRQTSFNTLRSRCKNIGTSNQSEQEAPSDQDVPDTDHHSVEPKQDVLDTYHHNVEPEHVAPLDENHTTDKDVDAMETDQHLETQSPIISQ